jgi:drug/metabolite transporter (DMT)-like permease
VDPGVAAAVLAASLLHASWHALVKSSGDRVVALAGMSVVSGAVALGVIPFVRLPTALAAAVIAGSVLLHGGYKLALAHLYARADLSQAYPVARGLTPVIATGFGLFFLGEFPASMGLLGIIAIAAGVAGLMLERRAERMRLSTLGAAVAAGTAVAAYSVLDAYGVRVNGDWLGFTAWLVACDSAAFSAYAVATRGSAARRIWRREWGRTLVSGLLGIAAFGVFMWALGRAQVGPVTALRETSVIFAAILGAMLLKERMSAVRWMCAAAVMAGAVAISLSR